MYLRTIGDYTFLAKAVLYKDVECAVLTDLADPCPARAYMLYTNDNRARKISWDQGTGKSKTKRRPHTAIMKTQQESLTMNCATTALTGMTLPYSHQHTPLSPGHDGDTPYVKLSGIA